MKRSLLVGSLCSFAILSGFAACGKAPVVCDGETLTTNAQACSDRTSLGFAREFNSGTFIGTKPIDTIAIRNGGAQDLTITSANLSGDSAFTLVTEPAELPATIKANKAFYLQVTFAPTAAKLYTGKIVVESNAENGATKEFGLSGCGVPTDGGASPCYRDGGQ